MKGFLFIQNYSDNNDENTPFNLENEDPRFD